MPDNVGVVWFNIGSAVKPDFSYPLDIGDGKNKVYIDNLNKLNFYFEDPDDKIALIYEVEI